MSDPERGQDDDPAEEEFEEEPRNPFDNPYLLPVLLGGFAIWCGWDGFLSDKFIERPGTLWFNRIAFLVLGALSGWMTMRARREASAPKSDAP